MAFFKDLKVKHVDIKFVFLPSIGLLLLSYFLSFYLNNKISIAILIGLSLLIVLTAIFHTYRGVIQEIKFQDYRNQAMLNIHSLIKPIQPLPYLTGWAAFPELISCILSEVMRSKPNHILEIGSGSSTLITSYVLKQLKTGKISSIDHSEFYANKTISDLELHELSEFASIYHTPLVDQELNGKNYKWYDTSSLSIDDIKIDILVVDGPPEKTQKYARYPALPLFYDRLSKNAIIILDDAARKEEQEIVKMWLHEFPGFEHEYVSTQKGISILRRS